MSSDASGISERRPDLVRIGDEPSQFFVTSFVNDADRFVRLFRLAIRRIPEKARLELSSYWLPIGPNSPRIILIANPIILNDTRTVTGIGMSEDAGRTFQFAGPVITEIDDELGQCLIAHELERINLKCSHIRSV